MWAMRNSHIGDAFFDLDAAAFLFSEIESNASAASHPSHGSLDLQVRCWMPPQQLSSSIWHCGHPEFALPTGGTATAWGQLARPLVVFCRADWW